MLYRRTSMANLPRPARSPEGGFTISEFVLVIVVVVALLVVITVSVDGIKKDGSASECRTELRRIKVATERYQAENLLYPTSVDQLVAKKIVKADDVSGWEIHAGSTITTPPTYVPVGECG